MTTPEDLKRLAAEYRSTSGITGTICAVSDVRYYLNGVLVEVRAGHAVLVPRGHIVGLAAEARAALSGTQGGAR